MYYIWKPIPRSFFRALLKGFVPDIFRSYFDLKGSFFNQQAKCKSEATLLAYSFVISIVLFLERLPGKVVNNSSSMEATISPLLPMIGIDLFASIFFVPLFLYLIAAVLHILFLPFNGKASFFESRLAFFWSAIICSPIILIYALLEVLLKNIFLVNLIQYLMVVITAWIFSLLLCTAEGVYIHRPIFISLSFTYFLLSYLSS